ncbi:MAG TPA: hypothetical protein EYP58_02490 [bacterium (Candidatus Stahlbacteria)]|nr:hypothetical protein [Candidatus Stahlbacteria bacterium]
MHRGRFFILTFIGVFLVGIAATVSTNFIGGQKKVDLKPIKENIDRFGFGVVNLIANSGFTEDAYLSGDLMMLSEYNIRFKRSSANFKHIHFLDAKGRIISSSDTSQVGRRYKGKINLNTLKSKGRMSVPMTGYSLYASSIKIGDSIYGYVITEIENKISLPSSSVDDNLPMKLIPGIVLAIIGGVIFGLIAMSSAGRIEQDVAEELASQQEAVFSPKVRRLKEELEGLQAEKDDIESRIKAGEESLNEIENKKQDLDRQLKEHPVVKSIDKLKESETKLMEELNNLKAEKERFEADVKKIQEEREEVLRKIEVDRQEEKTLHEKLELIKKKILKLE